MGSHGWLVGWALDGCPPTIGEAWALYEMECKDGVADRFDWKQLEPTIEEGGQQGGFAKPVELNLGHYQVCKAGSALRLACFAPEMVSS